MMDDAPGWNNVTQRELVECTCGKKKIMYHFKDELGLEPRTIHKCGGAL